jgi:hypothetical protein
MKIHSYSIDKSPRCAEHFKAALHHIKKSNIGIIVASRWSFKLFPIKDEFIEMPYQNSEGGLEIESFRKYSVVINGRESFTGLDKKNAVTNLIDGLLTATDHLYVVYPFPEIGWDIARMNISHYSQNNYLLNEISIPHSDYINRNKFINSIFDEYNENSKFLAIKPENIFCDTFVKKRCVAQYLTIPYYYDDDHLSDVGAALVVKKIEAHLVETAKIK